MDRPGSWFDAARPAEALLAPMAVLVGSAYAHFDARSGPGLAATALCAFGAFAAGCGVNLVEHAWDAAPPQGAGPPAAETAPPIDARDAGIVGAAAIVVAALCGLALVPLAGSAALGYGTVAVALGVLRRAPNVGLDELGWGLGELATLAALGPLAVLAGFASQAGTGSMGAFIAGVPAGFIAAAASFARHFTRRAADVRRERQTPVAALGEDEARRGLVLLPLLAVAAAAITARSAEYPPWAAWGGLPMIAAAFAAWRLPKPGREEAYAMWQRLAFFCAIAALAFIAAALWIAKPD
jgi:1,4-dihydroxy-2-naphthoate octaprenyltransferase